jgi:hypothetical protein
VVMSNLSLKISTNYTLYWLFRQSELAPTFGFASGIS